MIPKRLLIVGARGVVLLLTFNWLARGASASDSGAGGGSGGGCCGECPSPPGPPCCGGGGGGGGGGGSGSSGDSAIASSLDPNQKLGPGGIGPGLHIMPGTVLPYRIDFENDPKATAPAQQVILSDQLSPNLDWPTFELADLGFGDVLLPIPPRTQHFETNVLITCCSTPFEVQIEAGIRVASGQVYAVFRSIDPATSLPPQVNVGFLPPEDGTGRGQGHLSYLVSARSELPTGAEIRNVALIEFDRQAPIATNQRDPHDPAAGTDPDKEALNRIDADPPSSAVVALAPTTSVATFPVNWSGADAGSGIAKYDIHVSTNGGPWGVWLNGTTNTMETFTGRNARTYAFFSVARDLVGYVEPAPETADAVTRVELVAPTVALTASLAPAPDGQNVLVTLTYPVVEGWTYTVESRDDLGSGGEWEPLPGTPHNSGFVTEPMLPSHRYYRLRLE